MSDLLSLRDRRERAIAVLTEAFARDAIDLDEFERRLGLAHGAGSPAELEPLVADLQGVASSAPAPAAASRALVPLGAPREKQRLLAFFGGVSRRGDWTPARRTSVIAAFGGADLDFRGARLPPGVTELRLSSFFGGAHVIVPPELAVEVDGVAIFGGFDHLERAPAAPDPERPLLRVTGVALFGGVSVETRLPGESHRDARRRRRRERRQARRDR